MFNLYKRYNIMVKLTNKKIMIIGVCLLVLVIILCLLNNSNILSLFLPLKENYSTSTNPTTTMAIGDRVHFDAINAIEKGVTIYYLENILGKNITLKDKDGTTAIIYDSGEIIIKPFIFKEDFYTDILFKILEYKYKKVTHKDVNGVVNPDNYDNDRKLINKIKDLINKYKADINRDKTMFDFDSNNNPEYEGNLNVIFKGVVNNNGTDYSESKKKEIIEYTFSIFNNVKDIINIIDDNTNNTISLKLNADNNIDINTESATTSNKKDIINSLVTLYTDKLKYESLNNEVKYMNHLISTFMSNISTINGSQLTVKFNDLYDTVLVNLSHIENELDYEGLKTDIDDKIKKIEEYKKPQFVSDNIKYIQNHAKLLKVFEYLFKDEGVITKFFNDYVDDTNNAQLKARLILELERASIGNIIDTFEDIGKLNSAIKQSDDDFDLGILSSDLIEKVVKKLLYTIEPSKKPADPADPSDPAEPADPAVPADPADPAEPSEPAELEEPSDIADPVVPAVPAVPAVPSPNQCVINFGDKVGKHHILSKYSGATYNVEIVEDNLTTDGKAMIIYNKPFREGEHQNDILKLDASGQNLVVGPKNEYGAEDKRERWLIFDDNRVKSMHNLDLALQYDTGYLTIRPIQDYYPEGQKWELKEGPANPGVKSHVSLPVQSLASDGGMMMNQDNIAVGLHNQHKAQLSNILSLINSNLQAYQEKTTETENVFGNKEPIKLKLTLSGDTAKYEDVMADKESFKNVGTNNNPTVIDLLNRHQNKSSFASVENDLTRTLESSNECPKINYNDYYSNRVGQCNCDLTGL